MNKKHLIYIIILIIFYQTGFAQCTFTTTGAASTWFNTASWSKSGSCAGSGDIPNPNGYPYDRVVINHSISKNTGQTIIGDGSSITINNGGTFTIGGLVSVGNWGSPRPSLTINAGGTLNANGGLTITSSDNVFNNHGSINGTNITIEGAAANITNTGNIDLTGNFNFNGSRTFNNSGNITAENIVTGTNSAPLISTAGVLTARNDFRITGSSDINVSGGEIVVGRDFVYDGGTKTTINVPMTVGRNLNIDAGAILELGGRVDVAGNLNNTGGTSLRLNNVSSVVTVAGQITQNGSSHIIGQGQISWGTFSGTGGSYVECGGGTTTRWTASAPNINPLDLSTCTMSVLLPVEFGNISAVYNNSSIIVAWDTYSEKNNAYFTIQRSIDGIHFYDIDYINGGGDSHRLSHYSYQDKYLPESKFIYYRIIQTDYDGTNSSSNIVVVNSTLIAETTIYPNPIFDEDYFFVNNITEKVNIVVYDILGREIPVILTIIDPSTTNVRFKTQPEAGFYLIHIISDGKNHTHKIIVK